MLRYYDSFFPFQLNTSVALPLHVYTYV